MTYNFLNITNKHFAFKFCVLHFRRYDDDDVLTSLTIDDHDKDAVIEVSYTTA